MKIVTLTLLILSLSANAAHNCQHYSRKIDDIKAQMRQGYTIKKGEYLKRRLARLQDERIACERKSRQIKKTKQQLLWRKKQKNNQKVVDNMASKQSVNGTWTATSPSKARLKQWQLLQSQENEKLKKLKQKYQGVIAADPPPEDDKE